jgi:hypothetical protein
MNIPCKSCGNESSESDKFCRQCGGQLITESDFSSAATLNHAKDGPNPAVAKVGTGRFPPSAADVVLGETERYYSPPQYTPPPVIISQPADLSLSRPPFTWHRALAGFMKGLGLFLLIAGLMTATGLTVFFKMESDQERQRRYEAEQKARFGQNDANSQAQDAWGQINEALRFSAEAEKRAKIANASLSSNEDKSTDLGRFDYPGAQIEARSTVLGNRARSQITYHNFDTVKSHYDKLLGQPILQGVWNERKKLLYQASATPPILIRVEEIDETQVRITILQTLLRFNKLDEH